MSTVKELFGTNNQALTCTLTSLANNGQQGSASVDNTSNLYLDALVTVTVKSNAASTTSTGYVTVYAYGTSDGGTTYSDRVTGTNAAQTLTNPPNLRVIGIINVVANAVTYTGGPFSVAAAFGGVLPDHWGIVVENKTGNSLDASVGSANYQGVQQQIV